MTKTLKNYVEGNAKELEIQAYLEKHKTILIDSVANPFWAFNYVLPHFKLGPDLISDFLILYGQSNSYYIEINEEIEASIPKIEHSGSYYRDFGDESRV